ncbi:hypothetical protein RHMOL_Rhmol06G0043300 [Rhododendron molle]|uniref:Uncharacterized protein n=1 Tax=Rhododendron molle TaxID=49168 RepID=A0ACC0N8R6_RHOML|nr:hypothetical protein RHMOL_Rhmol06G0043300 [Rhododendron molle]
MASRAAAVPKNQSQMVKKGSVEEGCISIGPWGRLRGEPWAYKANGRITRITIRHGIVIDSLLFQAENSDGLALESSGIFGGPGGHLSDEVCIDDPDEHLTAIKITFGEFEGQPVVQSLSFRTNLNKYGPYGSKYETSVSIPIEGGVIGGFHGRAGNYLSAIGIYVAPKIRSFRCDIDTNFCKGQEYAPSHLKTPSSMDLFVQRDTGPWGAQRGRHWDDGVFLGIKQVVLQTGCIVRSVNTNMVIYAIQFENERRDRESFTSPWHGSNRGDQWHKIVLDSAAGEVIVGIEGFYGPIEGTEGFEVMTSITIYTSRRKYGPYGENETGTHFSSRPSGGKAVGFFGRSGIYLNAIGVHMDYS